MSDETASALLNRASADSESPDAASQGPSRILVVRLGSMGDIIHTLPAVAMLRRAFPFAKLGWLVEQRWVELLAARGSALVAPRGLQKPLVDAVHVVDTLAWRLAPFSGETRSQALRAYRELRQAGYEVAVDFQGAIRSAALPQLAGVPRRIGALQPREKPATMFYTQPIIVQGQHVIEQAISLASALAPGAADKFCFPLPHDAAAECACEKMLRARGLSEFAILNPGAGWGAKCWPAERYATVARALAADGLRVVVNFGPGEEELARAVESAAGGAAVSLPASLGELIALTRRAHLFVGGDTGPMHLAAALAVPVVALFGPTDPARNGPISVNSVVLRSPRSRTITSHDAEPEAGLLRITAGEVIAAARQLLAQPSGAAP